MQFLFIINNFLVYTLAVQEEISKGKQMKFFDPIDIEFKKAPETTVPTTPAHQSSTVPEDQTTVNDYEIQTIEKDDDLKSIEILRSTPSLEDNSTSSQNNSIVAVNSTVTNGTVASNLSVSEEKPYLPTPYDKLVYSLLDPDTKRLTEQNRTDSLNIVQPTRSNVKDVGAVTPSKYYSPNPHQPPFGSPKQTEIDERKLMQALAIKSSADGTEERLYHLLLDPDRYEKDIRPTTHHTKPTNVTFGFLLNQIVEMDERNQVLTTRSWLNLNWMDQRLVWNHTEWGGIKTIYIPHHRLWKPDIILVNK